MGIVIRSAGMLATIQDLGRVGFQKSGIAVSGALDGRALAIANILVGNPAGEAGIEMTLLGATVEFTADNVVALTGADMGATLNGAPALRCAAIPVKAGDILACGMAVAGCRAYIAFAGGLDVPAVMGSKSTNLKCGIGGLQGRALKEGDAVAFSAPRAVLPNMERRRAEIEDYSASPTVLRAVPGPQDGHFAGGGLDAFFAASYAVTARADRMGCVLDGPPVPSETKSDIISDGIPLGGVQVSSDGKPIVMLADRQTTGGYAKIATVVSVDLPLLAQRKPGDAVSFKKVSVRAAQRAYRAETAALAKLARKLSR